MEHVDSLRRFGVSASRVELAALGPDTLAFFMSLLPCLSETHNSNSSLFTYLAGRPDPYLEDDLVMSQRFAVKPESAKRARTTLDWLRNDRGIETCGLVFGRLKQALREEFGIIARGEPLPSDPHRYREVEPRTRRRSRRGTRGGVGRHDRKKPVDTTVRLAQRIGLISPDGVVRHEHS